MEQTKPEPSDDRNRNVTVRECVRFRGDEEKAKAPYEGVDTLRPEDIAECILFALTRPLHVNIDELVVKALAQSSPVRIVRS